ncbi:MAG: hypothetical protein ABS81_29410 [Pseudonocardia sp. SCN 72-86]|nr:MAG: hypothetical protein ABS81_29410 [Pseudonocardia sp. SCN 72-86]
MPPPVSTAPAVAPGSVEIAGDVATPSTLTAQAIAALPQRTVSVSFASGTGQQQKSETGVLLSDLLPPTALKTTTAKNDLLNFAVLAVGADGYTAAVAYGEISPDFGNRGIMLATTEDGTPLARPRLVVPGDVKGGRYVSDLVTLRVVRIAS